MCDNKIVPPPHSPIADSGEIKGMVDAARRAGYQFWRMAGGYYELKPIAAAFALAAQPKADSGVAADDIALFIQTSEQFGDSGETDTAESKLLEWANRGWLECTHFEVTDTGREIIDGAIAKPANGGAG